MIVTLRQHLFRRVAILGIGLIGGSLARAIKKNNLAREIVGLSQSHETTAIALKEGIIDHAYHDVGKAVANADLVVLGAPVGIITGMLSMIGAHLRRGCIVTDVGSAKTAIVAAAQKNLPQHVFFVGSHPLAGSEKTGILNSRADLFANTTCIMTPTETTHRMARERVKALWTKVGAHVKMMPPDEHDKALAYISHLPHIAAFALMETVPKEFLEYAAQGLKDTTRIAASSPQMWSDICLGNRRNIIKSLDEIAKILAQVRKAISVQDQKTLMTLFNSAKAKRDSLSG